MDQLQLGSNGFISPCPYRENCKAYLLEDGIAKDGTRYTRGCNGNVWFCGSTKEGKRGKKNVLLR